MIELDEEIITTLRAVSINSAVRKKADELAQLYPKRHELVGEKAFQNFVRLAIEKSFAYELLADREVNGLLTMMYHLGSNFDKDPLFPWARFEPATTTSNDSFARLNTVYHKFIAQHKAIHGENNESMKITLQQLLAMDFFDLAPLDTDKTILDHLVKIFPQRAEAISRNILSSELIPAARSKSLGYALDPNYGPPLMAVLIFMHGTGFDTDPLFGPLCEILEQRSTHNREQILFSKYQQYASTIFASDHAAAKG